MCDLGLPDHATGLRRLLRGLNMFSTGETLSIVVASVSDTFSSLKLGFSVVYQLAIASTMLENKYP